MTTDERFISACRKVAELRPDLFEWDNKWSVLRYQNRFQEYNGISQFNATQDDIDAMAGVLGWEYEVSRYVNFEPAPKLELGGLTYGIRKIGELPQHLGLDEYPDKLTAAKEAFCAIVRRTD